jgi:hypothetical protein
MSSRDNSKTKIEELEAKINAAERLRTERY